MVFASTTAGKQSPTRGTVLVVGRDSEIVSANACRLTNKTPAEIRERDT
jgi:hypothetical protein